MKDKSGTKKSDSAYALVYSTDTDIAARCDVCGQTTAKCRCRKETASNSLVDLSKLKPAVRLERKGRAGKSVTIIYRLPPHQTFLKELSKKLKNAFGVGGTAYVQNGEGFIELQGEHSAQQLLKVALSD